MQTAAVAKICVAAMPKACFESSTRCSTEASLDLSSITNSLSRFMKLIMKKYVNILTIGKAMIAALVTSIIKPNKVINPKVIPVDANGITRVAKPRDKRYLRVKYNVRIKMEIVKTDNPGHIYEESATNLKFTVIKENFNVLRNLNKDGLITITCKGRSQEVVLKKG